MNLYDFTNEYALKLKDLLQVSKVAFKYQGYLYELIPSSSIWRYASMGRISKRDALDYAKVSERFKRRGIQYNLTHGAFREIFPTSVRTVNPPRSLQRRPLLVVLECQ